jgi:hypothetical protein
VPIQLPEPPESENIYSSSETECREVGLWQLDWPELGFAYAGVYIISPPSGWPVKVGISCAVQRRLAALQTSHWSRLTVFHYWLCENSKAAKTVERAAHTILKKDGKLMNGEWFDIREKQAPALITFAAEQEGIELAQDLPDTPKFKVAHQRLRELGCKENDRRLSAYSREAEKERRSPSNGMSLPYILPRVV